MISHLFYLHILVSWFWRMNQLFRIQLSILFSHPHIHMWTHPLPLPQTTPLYHRTHKESFVREVGFEARRGAVLKVSALFQVSELVGRSLKSGVGQSNVEKFSLGKTEGAWAGDSSEGLECRGRTETFFQTRLNGSYQRRETRTRINLQKKKKETSKLRHNLIKILRWLKHSLSFHPSKDKTRWVPKVYLRSGRKGRHAVPIPLYLYGRQLSICSLIKAMWHLRHRVKQMAVFCWTGL